MAFAILCWKITPESPRWLLTKKKVAQADLIMRKIAKTNGAQPPEDLMPRLIKIANDTSGVVYGMGSLFTSWKMFNSPASHLNLSFSVEISHNY